MVGPASLGLRWWGTFDEGSMLGYYTIPYPPQDNGDNSPECSAVTQFQPALARRAFVSPAVSTQPLSESDVPPHQPCFDQPNKKAKFSITLISPVGVDSLSNSLEVSRKLSNGRFAPSELLSADFLAGREGVIDASKAENKFTAAEAEWETVEFAETPQMSTYIVAWAVGRFSSISASYTSPLTKKIIPLRILAATPLQHIERGQGQLALDTLAKVMPIYEKLFDIPYPLPKLDILVCDAFDAGAMENLGLICGRAELLLFDPAKDGVSAKFQVVATVAHEAAHMWFGDAVTLEWWDQLWLNEGFATLVRRSMGEVVVLDQIEPSWNVRSTFIKFRRAAALKLDSLRSSHPVEMRCPDDAEDTISQIFDAISYEKGSAILRMLSNLIGEDVFMRGVSKYLKSNLFGNTTSASLWDAMTQVSGVNVAELMHAWTHKVGFPVVTVGETSDGLLLRQNRFLSTGDPTPEEDETLWTIPLDIRVLNSAATDSRKILMSTRELFVPLKVTTESIYTLNSETSGTFRVSYPAQRLYKLAEESSHAKSQLSLADRLGILEDAILLAEAGQTRTSSTLGLMKQLSVEGERLIWAEIALSLHRISNTWWEQRQEVRNAIFAFGASLFGPLVERLGLKHLETDDTETRVLRVLAITAAAATENESVIEFLRTSFYQLAAGKVDETTIDLVATIVTETVRHGGEQEYNIALAIYNSPPTPGHQIAAISGLTATRSIALLMKTAAMLQSGQVADQNMAPFLMGLAANPLSRRLVWQFVQGSWGGLEAKLQGSTALGKLVQVSFESFSSESDADAVEAFFQEKDTTTFDQPLQQGIETVRAKARWLTRDQEDVEGWLRENNFLDS
ncbi:hypothetical protein P7C70_g1541, partial [Phenoliferia sp. Uapishka_3]